MRRNAELPLKNKEMTRITKLWIRLGKGGRAGTESILNQATAEYTGVDELK